MNLERCQFQTLDFDDPFFESLKADYAEFREWFASKALENAYIIKSSTDRIDGFLYVKKEEGTITDVTPELPAARRIKIGTFKINAHSTKLGERLMKKVFDHAIFESVDEIYVTIFPHHANLIQLFERYGFQRGRTKTTRNGTEIVLVRTLSSPFTDVLSNYPLINLGGSKVYLLSLRPEWHTRLLPDSILNNEDSDIIQDLSHTNSIHKVYLTAMSGVPEVLRGDILLIYRTSDGQGPAHFRSVATSICAVEEYRHINSFNSRRVFLEYCKKYSVFTERELAGFWERRRYPHVIRFTYNIAFKKRVTRGYMIEEVGLDGQSYWGFMRISEEQFLRICQKGVVDENLIIR